MKKFLLRTLSLFVVLVSISILPLSVHAQSDSSTTTTTTTTTTAPTTSTSSSESTDEKDTTDSTTSTDNTTTTNETGSSNVANTTTTTTPTAVSAPATTSSSQNSIREYLPYILIAGSVILLISIVGILLSGRKSDSGEEVINVTPQSTNPPQESVAQAQVTDMSNIPANLTNQTMTDNISTASPTLGDIVSDTSSAMPSTTMDTPVMDQVQPTMEMPQMPPVETVTEQVVPETSMPTELPQSQPEFTTTTVIDQTATLVPESPVMDTQTDVLPNVATQPIEQPTIMNPADTVPLVETPAPLQEQPVVAEPVDVNPANTVPLVENTTPLTEQTTTSQQDASFGVPAVEPVSTNPTETVPLVENTTPSTEPVSATPVESTSTVQVSQDQVAADLQALISKEVNNIPTQQQGVVQQPVVDTGMTNDDDLPQVPPMM